MYELKLDFDIIDTNQLDIIYIRLIQPKKVILLHLSHSWAQTKQTIDNTLSDNVINCPVCQQQRGTWIDCRACSHGYCLDCYIDARIDGRGYAACLLCGIVLFDRLLTEEQMRAWIADILAKNKTAVDLYIDENRA